jgi:raffinose/stachyose/melibiose transport system substrate-binding protein
MKKSLYFIIGLGLFLTTLFFSCSKDKPVEVYFLNFKPEVAEVYEKVVLPAFEAANPDYKLKIVTAASGTYEQTFNSEVAKSNPPVIFQVNGPIGLNNQKNVVADLSSFDFYSILGDKSLALKIDGKILAIPYAVEGYGIIYNNAIMEKYFALPKRSTKINSMEDVKNFTALKNLVEDMQKHKDDLGIKGVFASTSMAAGNQWRWQSHTVNIPLFFEFLEDNPDASTITTGLEAKTIKFKYGKNYEKIMDLYVNNSSTPKTLLGGKTVDESMAEFALGQVAMVQNGNWADSQILNTEGSKVKPEDLKFLPIYTGINNEEKYCFCIGTENYLCINKNASQEAQKGADVFLTWLFSSSEGKKIVSEQLNFITPFNTFTESELPSDPLSKEVSLWMNKPNITSIPWTFLAIPSEEWKNQLGDNLLQYFEGNESWKDLEKAAISSWAKERSLTR